MNPSRRVPGIALRGEKMIAIGSVYTRWASSAWASQTVAYKKNRADVSGPD